MESLGQNWILLSKWAQKKSANLLGACEKGPISNFTALFCVKGTVLQPKTFTWVSFCDTKRRWKVWAKTESCFPNQPPKNYSICFQEAKRVQISNFIAFFWLKGKLLVPKTLSGLSFCYTEVWTFILLHWRALKTKSGFEVSPQKIESIVSRKTIIPFLRGLNWKPKSIFCTNCSWLFSVRK